jgi:hypothetical protein
MSIEQHKLAWEFAAGELAKVIGTANVGGTIDKNLFALSVFVQSMATGYKLAEAAEAERGAGLDWQTSTLKPRHLTPGEKLAEGELPPGSRVVASEPLMSFQDEVDFQARKAGLKPLPAGASTNLLTGALTEYQRAMWIDGRPAPFEECLAAAIAYVLEEAAKVADRIARSEDMAAEFGLQATEVSANMEGIASAAADCIGRRIRALATRPKLQGQPAGDKPAE